jgi:hypothetical protein
MRENTYFSHYDLLCEYKIFYYISQLLIFGKMDRFPIAISDDYAILLRYG